VSKINQRGGIIMNMTSAMDAIDPALRDVDFGSLTITKPWRSWASCAIRAARCAGALP